MTGRESEFDQKLSHVAASTLTEASLSVRYTLHIAGMSRQTVTCMIASAYVYTCPPVCVQCVAVLGCVSHCCGLDQCGGQCMAGDSRQETAGLL